MPTQRQVEAMNLYCALMEEVKVRILFTEKAAGGGLVIQTQLVRETCYLQLRLICELIALGCLTVHGDIKTTQDKIFQKQWDAAKIMDGLEQLHPSFYPLPVNTTTLKQGHMHLEPITSGFLTKADLNTLYGRSGDFLHRGTIKKLLRSREPIGNTDDILDWLKKIGKLLSNHQVMLFDRKVFFLCTLSATLMGGRCQVAIAEAPVEPPPEIIDDLPSPK